MHRGELILQIKILYRTEFVAESTHGSSIRLLVDHTFDQIRFVKNSQGHIIGIFPEDNMHNIEFSCRTHEP